jgi:nucleoside-diphosphate-sugar epimerase
MVKAILATLGGPRIEPIVQGVATNEIDRQSLASGKALEMLGWKPQTGLSEGLRESIAWYARHLAAAEDVAGAPSPQIREGARA